jgi:hypothetical protein
VGRQKSAFCPPPASANHAISATRSRFPGNGPVAPEVRRETPNRACGEVGMRGLYLLPKSWGWLALAILVASASSISLAAQNKSYPRMAQFTSSAEIPGAKRVGSQACGACHAKVAGDFRHAYHAQQGIQCEDCHGGGSLHVQGGGDVSKIINFGRLSPKAANGVCLSCHFQDESVRNWMAGPHAANSVRCIDCHQVHGSALKAAGASEARFDTVTQGAAQGRAGFPRGQRDIEADVGDQ